MELPLVEIARRILPKSGDTSKYLSQRRVNRNDLLLVVHPLDTSWPELPDQSLDYLVKLASLAQAFDNLGGDVYELKPLGEMSFQQFLESVGVLVTPKMSFDSVPYGWDPSIGVKKFVSQLKKALGKHENARLLLAGSKLNDNMSDIPWGCVGGLWEGLNERRLPSFILQDYCFQYGASMYRYRVDDLCSIKPGKKYQGCI